MSDVFISYSRKDVEFARRLTASLEQHSVDVWFDQEDIHAGVKWSTAIQEGLRAAQSMIVIISPESMASTNVEDEWQYFIDHKKPLIPVLLKPADIHFQLSRIQYIDFANQDYDMAFERLIEELRTKGVLCAPPQSAEPIPMPFPTAQIKRAQSERKRNTQSNIVYFGIVAVIVIAALLLRQIYVSSVEQNTSMTETAAVQVAASTVNSDVQATQTEVWNQQRQTTVAVFATYTARAAAQQTQSVVDAQATATANHRTWLSLTRGLPGRTLEAPLTFTPVPSSTSTQRVVFASIVPVISTPKGVIPLSTQNPDSRVINTAFAITAAFEGIDPSTFTMDDWNEVFEQYTAPFNLQTPLGQAMLFDIAIHHGIDSGYFAQMLTELTTSVEQSAIFTVAFARYENLSSEAETSGDSASMLRADFWLSRAALADWQLQGDSNGNININGQTIHIGE